MSRQIVGSLETPLGTFFNGTIEVRNINGSVIVIPQSSSEFGVVNALYDFTLENGSYQFAVIGPLSDSSTTVSKVKLGLGNVNDGDPIDLLTLIGLSDPLSNPVEELIKLVGVPAGGTTGQHLAKTTDDDYDTEWVTPASGNVQSDWEEANNLSDAFILNKPDLTVLDYVDDTILDTTGVDLDLVRGNSTGKANSIIAVGTTIDGLTGFYRTRVVDTAGSLLMQFWDTTIGRYQGTRGYDGILDAWGPWSVIDSQADVLDGGTTGQVLTKASAADQDLEWVDGDSMGGTKLVGTSLVQSDTPVLDADIGTNSIVLGDRTTSAAIGANSIIVGADALRGDTGSNSTAIGRGAGVDNSGANGLFLGAFTGDGNDGDNATILGNSAGVDNTGTDVVLVGVFAGHTNTGTRAVAVGRLSGASNTGDNQTAVGYSAGTSNIGISQTAVGFEAGLSNTGTRQTTVGSGSGENNTGADQAAFGLFAGLNNTGANQTATGARAGQSNSGHNQTSSGFQAGRSNTGANQTTVGYSSGQNNTGDDQVVMGFQSGLLNTGDDQTAVGFEAGKGNTSTRQTAIGKLSGLNNDSNNSTSLGAYTSSWSATGLSFENTVVIGTGTSVISLNPTKANQVILGNDAIVETVLRGQVVLDSITANSLPTSRPVSDFDLWDNEGSVTIGDAPPSVPNVLKDWTTIIGPLIPSTELTAGITLPNLDGVSVEFDLRGDKGAIGRQGKIVLRDDAEGTPDSESYAASSINTFDPAAVTDNSILEVLDYLGYSNNSDFFISTSGEVSIRKASSPDSGNSYSVIGKSEGIINDDSRLDATVTNHLVGSRYEARESTKIFFEDDSGLVTKFVYRIVGEASLDLLLSRYFRRNEGTTDGYETSLRMIPDPKLHFDVEFQVLGAVDETGMFFAQNLSSDITESELRVFVNNGPLSVVIGGSTTLMATSIVAGVWRVKFDGTTIELFQNGTLVETKAADGARTASEPTATFTMCMRHHASQNAYEFNYDGVMANVIIRDELGDFIAHWPIDDGTDIIINKITEVGPRRLRYELSPNSSYIEIPEVSNTGDFVNTFHYVSATDGLAGSDRYIYSSLDTSTGSARLHAGTNGILRVRVATDTGNIELTSGAVTVTKGRHKMVLERIGNTFNLYLDDVLVDTDVEVTTAAQVVRFLGDDSNSKILSVYDVSFSNDRFYPIDDNSPTIVDTLGTGSTDGTIQNYNAAGWTFQLPNDTLVINGNQDDWAIFAEQDAGEWLGPNIWPHGDTVMDGTVVSGENLTPVINNLVRSGTWRFYSNVDLVSGDGNLRITTTTAFAFAVSGIYTGDHVTISDTPWAYYRTGTVSPVGTITDTSIREVLNIA